MARNSKRNVVKKKVHKLGIGMGPAGKDMRVVSCDIQAFRSVRLGPCSFRHNGLIVICVASTTQSLANSMSLWQIHLGTYT